MSMYLPNDEVGPTGAEGAEFVDVPVPAPEEEADHAQASAGPETDEASGPESEEPGAGDDAGD